MGDDYQRCEEVLCAYIDYETTGACQVYSLHEGCYANESCSGQFDVTGGKITTSFAPTPAPYAFDCPAYSVTQTNSDEQDYASCDVYACPGATLTLSGCNSDCVGDQYLRLFNSSGVQVCCSVNFVY